MLCISVEYDGRKHLDCREFAIEFDHSLISTVHVALAGPRAVRTTGRWKSQPLYDDLLNSTVVHSKFSDVLNVLFASFFNITQSSRAICMPCLVILFLCSRATSPYLH